MINAMNAIASLREVDQIAASAHADQVDKLGEPYINHPRAVAHALARADLSEHYQQVALLHDVIEDTNLDADALLAKGVAPEVVMDVQALSRPDGITYMNYVRELASSNPRAAIVKLADNAHNSSPDRAQHLDEDVRIGLAHRYARARKILLRVVSVDIARSIFEELNPSLLNELNR